MAKATRVPSTPRRTASKTKRPLAKKLPGKKRGPIWTDAVRSKLHDDMEGPLLDAIRMAQIAEQAAGEDEGMRIFATLHLVDMVRGLREIWNGRPAGPILGK